MQMYCFSKQFTTERVPVTSMSPSSSPLPVNRRHFHVSIPRHSRLHKLTLFSLNFPYTLSGPIGQPPSHPGLGRSTSPQRGQRAPRLFRRKAPSPGPQTSLKQVRKWNSLISRYSAPVNNVFSRFNIFIGQKPWCFSFIFYSLKISILSTKNRSVPWKTLQRESSLVRVHSALTHFMLLLICSLINFLAVYVRGQKKKMLHQAIVPKPFT